MSAGASREINGDNMGKINMVKNIKEIHPTSVILLQVGAFCETYGKDSYILSYLFGYQIKQKGDNNIPKTGFSKKALPKVLSRIEEEKIDYLLLDVRNNYNVDDKCENRNLNMYNTIYEKAQKYVKRRRKIDEINKKLVIQINKSDFKDKIKKIEEIINEN